MEYLWAASVTAMLTDKWIWAVSMYLFLFYACCKLPFPKFMGAKPWILTALGVRIAAIFLPNIFEISWGLTALHSVLYFWVWYQCFQGIRQIECIYGSLNGQGIFSAYWVELVLAAVELYAMGLSTIPWFGTTTPSAIILVQIWKAHLLYHSHRNYEIRRRQLAQLSDEI